MVDDPEGDYATNPYLTPLLQTVIDDLTLNALRNPNIGALKFTIVLPGFPAALTSFAAGGYFDTNTVGPGDGELFGLMNILSMREKPAGTADINYLPMTPVSDLPIVVQNSYNQIYLHLQGTDILVPGATQALDVRIFGAFEQPMIKDEKTPILSGIQAPLKFGLAAAVCCARGNVQLGATYDKKYLLSRNDLLNQIIMDQQQIPNRPKGFSDAAGIIGSNFAY